MKCTNCGREIGAGAMFCTGCGMKVTDMASSEEQKSAGQPQWQQTNYTQNQSAPNQNINGNNYSYNPNPSINMGYNPNMGMGMTANQVISYNTYVDDNGKRVPTEYKPIKAWGYFGYNILFAIPLVGFIFLLVYALGGTHNINLKNYARSFFCVYVLALIILLVVFLFAMIFGISDYM